MSDFSQARALLRKFKGDRYLFGVGMLAHVGDAAAALGKRAALIRDTFPGSDVFVQTIRETLAQAGVMLVGEIPGAGPNAPREDLFRITDALKALDPDVILSFGGGSTIDATKAAEVLRTLGGEIDDYFGTGLITQAATASGKTLTPHVAIQTAASSGAHLTKYANITDVSTGQKKLIVDDAIVPVQPVFDYTVTYGAPPALTMDGALDGISHALEVLYGAVGQPAYAKIKEVAGVCYQPGGELSAARAGEPARRSGARGALPGDRPRRLCHHARRDQRRAPHQLLAGRRAQSRARLRDDESLLHRLLRPGDRGSVADAGPYLPGRRSAARRLRATCTGAHSARPSPERCSPSRGASVSPPG